MILNFFYLATFFLVEGFSSSEDFVCFLLTVGQLLPFGCLPTCPQAAQVFSSTLSSFAEEADSDTEEVFLVSPDFFLLILLW